MIGAYPGTFDPPTTAHLAIAEAARHQCGLERVDLVLSREPLGKTGRTAAHLAERLAVLEQLRVSRPWLGVAVTDALLVVDVAAGYDVVVLGADKWAQVVDPAWYGGSVAARDEALARLPHVAVAPRAGVALVVEGIAVPAGIEILAVDPDLASVSSTRARAGETHLMTGEARAHDARTGVWSREPDAPGRQA